MQPGDRAARTNFTPSMPVHKLEYGRILAEKCGLNQNNEGVPREALTGRREDPDSNLRITLEESE